MGGGGGDAISGVGGGGDGISGGGGGGGVLLPTAHHYLSRLACHAAERSGLPPCRYTLPQADRQADRQARCNKNRK